jgi:hypothetical protein
MVKMSLSLESSPLENTTMYLSSEFFDAAKVTN